MGLIWDLWVCFFWINGFDLRFVGLIRGFVSSYGKICGIFGLIFLFLGFVVVPKNRPLMVMIWFGEGVIDPIGAVTKLPNNHTN